MVLQRQLLAVLSSLKPEGRDDGMVAWPGENKELLRRGLQVSSTQLQLRLGFGEADNEAWGLSRNDSLSVLHWDLGNLSPRAKVGEESRELRRCHFFSFYFFFFTTCFQTVSKASFSEGLNSLLILKLRFLEVKQMKASRGPFQP